MHRKAIQIAQNERHSLDIQKERKEANKIMGWHGKKKKKKERAMCDGVIFTIINIRHSHGIIIERRTNTHSHEKRKKKTPMKKL